MSKAFDDKATAARYNAARGLPRETRDLWMATLLEMVPKERVSAILDLGAGTGRFSQDLHDAFDVPTIALEPSEAMFNEGIQFARNGVEWRLGCAEDIPAATASVGLVWMSQVFHHLNQPDLAFQEVRRVLVPGGFLVLRNGTIENDVHVAWTRFFPEAHTAVPSRQEAVDAVCRQRFRLVEMRTVQQRFVASYEEYYCRISQRGLSALIGISDAAFEAGLRRLAQWTRRQPSDQPVCEPMDIFLFKALE